jgi:hypothetical protein
MNTSQGQIGASRLSGNQLRFGDQREIAIYLRDGMAWVAEFNCGRVSISTASQWFSVNQGGRVLRQMDLASIAPLPEDVMERIEQVHQCLVQAERQSATAVARFRRRLVRLLRSILGKPSAQPHQTATSADSEVQ